jgi:hypothetical protein
MYPTFFFVPAVEASIFLPLEELQRWTLIQDNCCGQKVRQMTASKKQKDKRQRKEAAGILRRRKRVPGWADIPA